MTALDGKVLRGAWTDVNDQVTLFSAMVHGLGVTVAQIRVPGGTTEVTQAGALLANIPLQDSTRVIVTIDAAHTQRATAGHIKAELGPGYIMTVKGNQPTLHNEILARFTPLVSTVPGHVAEECGHGRITRWSTWMTGATGIDSPHATQIGCIRRDEFALDGTPVSKEFAFIITSSPAGHTGPADPHTHVREHWGIENKSHYVRDVALPRGPPPGLGRKRSTHHGGTTQLRTRALPPQRHTQDQRSDPDGLPRPPPRRPPPGHLTSQRNHNQRT